MSECILTSQMRKELALGLKNWVIESRHSFFVISFHRKNPLYNSRSSSYPFVTQFLAPTVSPFSQFHLHMELLFLFFISSMMLSSWRRSGVKCLKDKFPNTLWRRPFIILLAWPTATTATCTWGWKVLVEWPSVSSLRGSSYRAIP